MMGHIVENRESPVTQAKPANDPLENILYATSVGVQLPKQLQRHRVAVI